MIVDPDAWRSLVIAIGVLAACAGALGAGLVLLFDGLVAFVLDAVEAARGRRRARLDAGGVSGG